MAATHRGPWQDDPDPAVRVALDEVRVDEGDWLKVEKANGYVMVPLDPSVPWRIDVEVVYSEHRDQYRAVLRKVPA